MVYATDSKSVSRKGLRVRVPPAAPSLVARDYSSYEGLLLPGYLAQLVRALSSHDRGRWFEPTNVHHKNLPFGRFLRMYKPFYGRFSQDMLSSRHYDAYHPCGHWRRNRQRSRQSGAWIHPRSLFSLPGGHDPARRQSPGRLVPRTQKEAKVSHGLRHRRRNRRHVHGHGRIPSTYRRHPHRLCRRRCR